MIFPLYNTCVLFVDFQFKRIVFLALGRAMRSGLFFDLDRLGADKNSIDLKMNWTTNSDLSLIQYNNNNKKK